MTVQIFPSASIALRAAVAALAGAILVSGGALAGPDFKRVAVFIERNISDKDIEVRFVATTVEKGLSALRVLAPDGRTIIDFKAPDSKVGIRHLDFETPEPKEHAELLADFPPGVYRFEGVLVGGEAIKAEATLSHALPDAPSVTSPRAEKDVPSKGAKVRWAPVKDAVSYVVVLEGEEEKREFRTTLPSNATSLNIPDGFMVPGSEYKLSVGAVVQGGNTSFIEIEFAAGKR